MRIRYLLMMFLILLAGCNENPEPEESDDPLFFLLKRLDAVEKAKNRIYRDARNSIIAAGWKPLQTNSENDDKLKSGSTREFWKKGYIEVEECGGNQITFCNFIFQDSQGNKLFVTTSANDQTKQSEVARVTFTQIISEYKPSNPQ